MRLLEIEDLSWTTDAEKAEMPHYLSDDDFVQLNIHIRDFFKNVSKDVSFDLDSDDGGENVKQYRLERALQHFADKQPMDLPVVSWNQYTDGADITNGRHRLYAAHKLGKEYAPAFVWKNNLDKFKQKIRTR